MEKARLWGQSLSRVLQLLLLEFGNEALYGFSKAIEKTPGLTPDVWIAAAHRGFNKDRCKNVHRYQKAEELLEDKYINHLMTTLLNHTLKDVDDTMSSYLLELNAEFETKEPFVEHPTPDLECKCTRKAMLKLMMATEGRSSSDARTRCKDWCSTHPEWAYAMMALGHKWCNDDSGTEDKTDPTGGVPDKSVSIGLNPVGSTLEESTAIIAAKLKSEHIRAYPDPTKPVEEEEVAPSVSELEAQEAEEAADRLAEDYRQGGWDRESDRS